MYNMYADSKRYKTELISVNETGLGGFKEVTFMINGDGAYYDYSADAVVEMLAGYLSPRVSELLREAK